MKFYNKSVNYFTNVFLEKIVKSNYLKNTSTVIPLTLLTIVIKAVFNFLITYRLTTNNYYIDFLISLINTIVMTLFSPYIYKFLYINFQKDLEIYSKMFIDLTWDEGWIFLIKWKNRFLGFLGIFAIFILFFIEINSRMIQEFILHTIITSLIVDSINAATIKSKESNSKKQEIKTNAKEILSISVKEYLIIKTNSDKYVVYKVNSQIKTKDDKMESWTSFHRFTDFEKLDKQMRDKYPDIPEFIDKTWYPSFDKEFLENRCKKLDRYLKSFNVLDDSFLAFLYQGEIIKLI